MTKSTYEARATKFARLLVNLLDGCSYVDEIAEAVDAYNATHTRKLHWAHGVSRAAFIRSDYVVKFDMIPVGRFSDGSAGDIYSEARVYARAEAEGMAHLLAKVTLGQYHGRSYSIMPRISGIHDDERYYGDYCTEEELDWLWENVNDLHSGNLGYRNGKVCVIDYAWDAEG